MQQVNNNYSASDHYVWRCELLGEGAFGTVFKGVHKETGELVAVKTFNRNGTRNSGQLREMSIISQLNHPNIVKLIAIEKVNGTRGRQNNFSADSIEGKVLIMELCTEGSLFTNLDRPENQFGFNDAEFLLILEHMTNGLRYLHEKKIIHRDWKPSNILKTIAVDGKTFYKLCDFGAAKMCEENGQFMSIVGTEEYLNPVIYGRAMLGGPHAIFAATSDLWSIGATLYQSATALLPFRPYGGRKNKEIMHRMMTEKESGVISGYQESENGPIRYKRDLPPYCQLTSGLRPLVTKLLAGLLESKTAQLWNFERYFREVDKILNKVAANFYVLGESKYRTVYLDRTAEFKTFEEEIAAQTGSSTGGFAFVSGSELLREDNWDIRDFLPQQKSPIVLVPSKENGCRPQQDLGLPVEPTFVTLEAPTVDWDAEAAKVCLSVGNWINVQLKERQSIRRLLFDTAAAIKSRLDQNYNSIKQQWSPLKFAWSVLQKRLDGITKSCQSTGTVIGLLAPKQSSALQITKTVADREKEMLDLQVACSDFERLDSPKWTMAGEKEETTAMEQLLNEMASIYSQFRKEKAMRMDLNPDTYHNELKWHALQKKLLQSYWQSCKEKLGANETERFHKYLKDAVAFLRPAMQLLKNLENLEPGVRNAEEMIRAFDSSLDKLPIDVQAHDSDRSVPSVVNQNGNQTAATISTTTKKETGGALESIKVASTFLSMVKEIQEMRGVAQENRQLLDRFPNNS